MSLFVQLSTLHMHTQSHKHTHTQITHTHTHTHSHAQHLCVCWFMFVNSVSLSLCSTDLTLVFVRLSSQLWVMEIRLGERETVQYLWRENHHHTLENEFMRFILFNKVPIKIKNGVKLSQPSLSD
jgi:hypothetical protein